MTTGGSVTNLSITLSPRVYLAAQYSRREELCVYRDLLVIMGYQAGASWLVGPARFSNPNDPDGTLTEHQIETGAEDDPYSQKLRHGCAQQDIKEIRQADIFVLFTEPVSSPAGRGGRFVELGIALSLGKKVIIVGYLENMFTCEFVQTGRQFLQLMLDKAKDAPSKAEYLTPATDGAGKGAYLTDADTWQGQISSADNVNVNLVRWAQGIVIKVPHWMNHRGSLNSYLVGEKGPHESAWRAEKDSIKAKVGGDTSIQTDKQASVELLQEASRNVSGPRKAAYGKASQNFDDTARIWSVLFDRKLQSGVSFSPSDVALAMTALKQARLMNDQPKTRKDSWSDMAGYAALGYECDQDDKGE